ncbi:hypothetical protein Y1Q_0010849 [Alligator mississippiensis]|uniref:Beta-defensin n=1 Tax=Alligator mississippiensis TaxID=8496 RepID=A0A151M729_ALLMI|nr:hypothetical protein Y1Q_0010849 [Alligator mississippiensis]
MLSFVLLLLPFISTVAADTECTKLGGTCYNYRLRRCWNDMLEGKCHGHSDRRCCLPCHLYCKMNEHMWIIFKDRACLLNKGICQFSTNYCSGSYTNYKCGGPSSRQCCLPSKMNPSWPLTR